MNSTFAELLTEFYRDLYRRKEAIERQIKEPISGAHELSELNRQLDVIHGILRDQDPSGLMDDEPIADPLVDKWLRELEEGKTPDLSEGLPDGFLKRT